MSDENGNATDVEKDEVRDSVEAIARRAAGTDITPRDQFDLTIAVDHGARKRHNATKRQVAGVKKDVAELTDTVAEHLVESEARDRAIAELQEEQETTRAETAQITSGIDRHLQGIVADTSEAVRKAAEGVATKLEAKTEETAAQLKEATELVAAQKLRAAERQAVTRLLSRGARIVLTMILFVVLGAVGVIVFTDSDGLAPSIVIFMAAMSAVTVALSLVWRNTN
jgi:hypothetical protein